MRNSHALWAWIITLLQVLGPCLRAWPGQGAPPAQTFEVASIKPNTSRDLRQELTPSLTGRFTARNVSLRALINFAYDVQPFQIEGGPAWIANDRFDVLARAEGDATSAQQRA